MCHPSFNEFVGWSETRGGEVAYQPGDSITVTAEESPKTLYAVWAQDEVIACFDLNGGYVSEIPEGWTKESDDTYTKVFPVKTRASVIIQDFGDYHKDGYKRLSETVSVGSNVRITAQWEQLITEVTLDLNGGVADPVPEG